MKSSLSFRPVVLALAFAGVTGGAALGYAEIGTASSQVVQVEAKQFNDDVCIGRANTRRIDEQGRVWEWRKKQGPVQPGKCPEWHWVRVG